MTGSAWRHLIAAETGSVRDTSFFEKSLTDGFSVEDKTYALKCIPMGQHKATLAASSMSFRRETYDKSHQPADPNACRTRS